MASFPVRDPVGDHPLTPQNSAVALAVEPQRDWGREETVADVIEIVLTGRLLKT
jgi:hypothetical protein